MPSPPVHLGRDGPHIDHGAGVAVGSSGPATGGVGLDVDVGVGSGVLVAVGSGADPFNPGNATTMRLITMLPMRNRLSSQSRV